MLIKMSRLFLRLLSILGILWLCSCTAPKDSDNESSSVSITSGDIVISSTGSRDVKVFDSTGIYKGTILEIENASGQAPYGLTYNPLTNEILVTVDSAGSRSIKGISTTSGVIRDFSTASALSGTLRGLAMLTSGDLLVVISSGNRVEKLNGLTGTQITAGAWPKSLQTAGSGIGARAGGTFVHCSTTTDVVRLYDAAGTQTATASSGITGTTDVMDCKADTAGNIYTSFNGTTDTVRKYNSTLASTTWSFSNTITLPNPSGLAVRSDGSVLVLDQTLNYVLVIAADGASATPLGNDTNNFISTPYGILIVP